MASRAIPPHQLISAPRMAMTPRVISAWAESVPVSASPRAASHTLDCIGSSSLAACREPASRQPGPVVLLQLTVGVDDLSQFRDHGTDLLAGQGVVELVVAQARVDTVADAAQAGHAAPTG